MPSVIGLIGARAGSERVLHKNIRPLAGQSLIAYAAHAAQRSGVVHRIVLSTDSSDIAAEGRASGVEVPLPRGLVKAATMHGLRVHDVDGRVEAEVILDV